MTMHASRGPALKEAMRLGPHFMPAMGSDGWWVIDTRSPIWHGLSDLELGRIGLRRTDLAPVRRDLRRQ